MKLTKIILSTFMVTGLVTSNFTVVKAEEPTEVEEETTIVEEVSEVAEEEVVLEETEEFEALNSYFDFSDSEITTITVAGETVYVYDYTGHNTVNDRLPYSLPNYIVYPDTKVTKNGANAVLSELGIKDHIHEYTTKVWVVNPVGDTYDNEVDCQQFIELLKVKGSMEGLNLKIIGIGAGATFVNEVVAQNSWAISGIMTYGGTMAANTANSAYSVPAYLHTTEDAVVKHYTLANSATKVCEAEGVTVYENTDNSLERVVASTLSDEEETLADAFNNAWATVLSKCYRINNRYTTNANGVTTFYQNDIVSYHETGYDLIPYVMFDELGLTMINREEVITENATPEKPNQWYEYIPAGFEDAEEGSVPLMVLLHGNGNDNRTQPETSGWLQKASEEGFMCIAPQWGAPAEEYKKYTDLGEGVIDLIKVLEERYPQINAGKVYLTGLSAGANAALTYGAKYNDVVTAVEGSSGPFSPKYAQYEPYKVNYIPAYLTGGAQDEYRVITGTAGYGYLKLFAYLNNIDIDLESADGDTEANPYYRVALDDQKWETIKNTPVLSGTLSNEVGVMIRAVAQNPFGHWNNIDLIDDMWEFLNSYTRDTETGELIVDADIEVDPVDPVDPTDPTDPEKPVVDPEKPTTDEPAEEKPLVNTGDHAIILPYAMVGLLAAGTLVLVERKRRQISK